MEEAVLGPVVQAGAVGLCMAMLGILFWVLKKTFGLLEVITMDVKAIQRTLDRLPCRAGGCPETEKSA